MRKKLLLYLLLTVASVPALADHITGGEMYYRFVGESGGQLTYDITLKLFMRCNSGRQFPNPIYISIFDKTGYQRISDDEVQMSNQTNLSLRNTNPCITNPPEVCYEVALYSHRITVPVNENGYLISAQVNFRIDGIANIFTGSVRVGATYVADVPGSANSHNTSAQFTANDLVVICADNSFNYSFAAKDADGDELRYSFCSAYGTNGGGGAGGNSSPPDPPPYQPLPYRSPEFDGSKPLGGQVQIDRNTGLITGIAPGEGPYVVTVCVEEVRNGKVIATQRKDIQINITSCSIAAATLLPEYYACRESKSVEIKNISRSPLIQTQNWTVFATNGNQLHTQTGSPFIYEFPDTGRYKVRLLINENDICSDSTTTDVLVYPGLKPSFSSNGICVSNPTQFRDRSSSVYGTVNEWHWDFGDLISRADSSIERNPSYTYSTGGLKQVILTVADSKGCRDTANRNVIIVDKPPVGLRFSDTLICKGDRLQLAATSAGTYSWSPSAGMIAANTATPSVQPAVSTTYFVKLNVEGCENTDSVRVRVTDNVELRTMPDTIICSGDPILLRIESDGLKFSWTPALNLDNPSVYWPTAVTNSSTNYQVTANIGSCQSTASIFVNAVPYPQVAVGPDTSICFASTATLRGQTDGNSYSWSPGTSLQSPGSLATIASPATSTTYVLTAYGDRGCPKPTSDSIRVTVYPRIFPFAGNDTSVVVGQPLQLNASGGIRYEWSPSTYLSDPAINNPIANFPFAGEDIRYSVRMFDEIGCQATASLLVKIFATGPQVFVPTGFTPNGDGRNDRLRPIAAGIQRIEYFRVFNRWGQLMYSQVGENGPGWDGNSAGTAQGTNTFVWIVKAIDFNGKPYFEKGTVTLIR